MQVELLKKVNVLNYGAKGKNIIFDTIGFQRALNIAKQQPVKIYVPEGKYYISKELVIYKHTHLQLHKDAEIIRMSPFALLKNGNKGDQYKGYEGNGFITIEGGTFNQNGHVLNFNNTIMSLGHAREITIKDVTFKNVVQGHAIDACGLDGFKVTGCKFLGFRDDSGERAFSEAIQIDLQLKDSFPKFGAYDATPTKNVIIENCYFGNSGDPLMKPWNRAIGSHASHHDVFYENITVRNNTFEGMGDYALTFLKSKVLHIHDNEFIDCAGGIRYRSTKSGKYTTDLSGNVHKGAAGELTVIRRNTFKGIQAKHAILFQSYEGTKNKDIYIVDNDFEGESCSVKIGYASHVVCAQNKNLNNIKKEAVDDFFDVIEVASENVGEK